jgi:homoserine O-succinyltransferase
MPIILPERLASAALLRGESIEVLQQPSQDSAVLRIGLLNLMPDKSRTEVQFARLLGATGREVELVLGLLVSYRAGVTGMEHYARWGKASLPRNLDGLIVTGAPLEHVPFDDVVYWRDLVAICDWAAAHVSSTIYVCWAAFAALHRFHGVPMRILSQKLSGIFEQQVMKAQAPLTARLGTSFSCPVSRHAEVSVDDVPWQKDLVCLARSPRSGLCLIADERCNAFYMFNHLEYDADTLKLEYLRDSSRRAGIPLPENYWPNDDISKPPPLLWRRAAEMLFANWLEILAARQGAGSPPHYSRSAA